MAAPAMIDTNIPTGECRKERDPSFEATNPMRAGSATGITVRRSEGGAESMARLFGKPQRTRPRGVVEQAIGTLDNLRGRFGRTTSAKSERGAYSKTVGLGVGALAALSLAIISVWLLRKRAREETAPVTPEPEEGVEAVPSEEEMVVPPDPPSAEDVPPREDPPPGEERPERRGETPTSPPLPREEPPPGEERPGRR